MSINGVAVVSAEAYGRLTRVRLANGSVEYVDCPIEGLRD